MDLSLAICLLVFFLGASVGSFLNVVIYRLPYGLSVAKPRSYCPGCKKTIPAWENVPVFSWIFLRARCSGCAMKISARYVLIEAAMGVLAVALFLDFAGGPLENGAGMALGTLGPFLAYLTFVAALVAIAFIDLDHFIIPDVITLPGTVIGVGLTFLAGHAIGIDSNDGLIGAVAGAGFIILIIVGYGALTGREGMGGGDWKLMAFIGAFLGWQALPFVMLAGSVQGLGFAVAFRRAFAVEELPPDPMDAASKADGKSQDAPIDPKAPSPKPFSQLAVPFGPFLSVAAIEFLLFRVEITAWMANLVNPL